MNLLSKYPSLEATLREQTHLYIRCEGALFGLGGLALGGIGINEIMGGGKTSAAVTSIVGGVVCEAVAIVHAKLDTMKTELETPNQQH
jgi:hypothetical protein